MHRLDQIATRNANNQRAFLDILTMLERILASFLGHSVPPDIGPLTDLPLISSPTHEMNIPQREGVCWKSHID